MARISFKINGEIKSFSDREKLREFNTTKPALQQMLKGLIQSRDTREEKRSTKSTPNNQKMAIGTYMSIITLHVNGLNAQQDPYICCLQETHFRPQDTYRLKVRGWKNIFHANGKQKKARVSILISDKIDPKIKIRRDKEGHYIMIKGSIQEEE